MFNLCLLRILVGQASCHLVTLVIISVSAIAHLILGITKVEITNLWTK